MNVISCFVNLCNKPVLILVTALTIELAGCGGGGDSGAGSTVLGSSSGPSGVGEDLTYIVVP